MLALAKQAGVSLDWVATGQPVRPDLAGGLADAGSGGFGGLPGFARLQPLRSEIATIGGRSVEPVGVVDADEQRRLGGDVGEQVEGRHGQDVVAVDVSAASVPTDAARGEV